MLSKEWILQTYHVVVNSNNAFGIKIIDIRELCPQLLKTKCSAIITMPMHTHVMTSSEMTILHDHKVSKGRLSVQGCVACRLCGCMNPKNGLSSPNELSGSHAPFLIDHSRMITPSKNRAAPHELLTR